MAVQFTLVRAFFLVNRLEDEAESLIAEARTERDVELERIRESDPEDLWRSSTRGKELLEQHRGLLDQVSWRVPACSLLTIDDVHIVYRVLTCFVH